jgi:hypothetical protein
MAIHLMLHPIGYGTNCDRHWWPLVPFKWRQGYHWIVDWWSVSSTNANSVTG